MEPTTLQFLMKLLDLVIVGARVAPSIKDAYDRQREKLDRIIAERRNPTVDEWNDLLHAIQAASDKIQSSKRSTKTT